MWYQLKYNGKYQFFERYKKDGRYHTVTVTLDGNSAKYQKQAQRLLVTKIDKALENISEVITLKELKDKYIRWKYENYKEQSAFGSDQKLSIIIRKLGENRPVRDVSASYYKSIMDEPATTYNERLKHFKAMIRWGYQNELIDNLSFIERIPRKNEPTARLKDQDKFLERSELKLLLSDMKDDYRLLTEFLSLTGMRIGEVIDLNVDDVQDRNIHVTSTYSLITKKSSTVKTEMSERIIYIQDELLSCVDKINNHRTKLKEKHIFFPVAKNKRIHYDSYRKYLRKHSIKTLGRKITPHIFRHTHTALLAEAGIPLEQISRRLGHADSKVTKEVYLHVTEKMIETENNRIKSLALL